MLIVQYIVYTVFYLFSPQVASNCISIVSYQEVLVLMTSEHMARK